MSATPLSLQEYLDTGYSPDREYVDGVIVERNVGKRHHSLAQSNMIYSRGNRFPAGYVWPGQRVRTTGSRVRIPDVCLTLEDPGIDTFDSPPFLCVEILSPDDTSSDLLEKLEEYAAMGVVHIWVVDPRRRKAYTYSARRLEEVSGADLMAGSGIVIPLAEVFARL